MVTVTLDEKKIGTYILVLGIVVLLAVIGLMYINDKVNASYQTGFSAGVASVPTPAPTPSPVPTNAPAGSQYTGSQFASYWTNYQRVISLTKSSGFPQAVFSDGRNFNVPWDIYDEIFPDDIVAFHVTGVYYPYGDAVYYVDQVTFRYHERSVISSDQVYYYNGKYYDSERHEIGWKNIGGRRVVHGRYL